MNQNSIKAKLSVHFYSYISCTTRKTQEQNVEFVKSLNLMTHKTTTGLDKTQDVSSTTITVSRNPFLTTFRYKIIRVRVGIELCADVWPQ